MPSVIHDNRGTVRRVTGQALFGVVMLALLVTVVWWVVFHDPYGDEICWVVFDYPAHSDTVLVWKLKPGDRTFGAGEGYRWVDDGKMVRINPLYLSDSLAKPSGYELRSVAQIRRIYELPFDGLIPGLKEKKK